MHQTKQAHAKQYRSGLTKYLFATCFALSVASAPVYAQEPQNAIAVDVLLPVLSPISHLAGEESAFVPINVKYQHVLSEHQVLMFKMGLNYNWGTAGESSVDIYPMLALDWHPFQTGLKSFYLGPSLFVNYSDYTHSGAATTTNLDTSYWIAVGGNFGYEFVLQSKLVVDICFGLGYGYLNEKDLAGNINSGYRIDETLGGVFVGYSF